MDHENSDDDLYNTAKPDETEVATINLVDNNEQLVDEFESDDDLEVVITSEQPSKPLTALNPSQPALSTDRGIDIDRVAVVNGQSVLDDNITDRLWTKPGADITVR